MAWRVLITKIPKSKTLTPKFPSLVSNPKPILSIFSSPFSTSFLITKTPKKYRKKCSKPDSPRTKHVQNPHLESILQRDSYFRFVTRSKSFLSTQPEHALRVDNADKLYREVGFPGGRKVSRFLQRHPTIFATYHHADNKMWVGFTEFMEELLLEEKEIMNERESDRVNKVRKLLMMSKYKRIPLSKIHHCRLLFGVPDDFRDRVAKYQEFFRIVMEDDGKRILELVKWDPLLAVSTIEREFLVDEDRVKKMFKFPVKYGKDLGLEYDEMKKLNSLNTLPMVSLYSDGWRFDLWSLEEEKYRVGVVHEFLRLTLEKRASIHHIVEFKEEFSLTRETYQMLKKQPQTFYLAGTEMNWDVFLKDTYDGDGVLIVKDPQVVFNDRLRTYAQMQEGELGYGDDTT
ncbi:PORR domain-containing protein [Cephalotus follicularis]|uniref:PORR domain-containing protein n=1 Tax=Cephalotus follicularis TaxID=3775 RepID=A0A1Q3D7T3_CEPFO|nr:PORR domain-containing protein [Cephalotus follicularis]